MDGDGYFAIVDSKKGVINTAGFKVWPREVEETLYAHPAVRLAAVVGVPDDYRGEAVKAYVVPEEAEEVLAVAPLVRRTKRGHYAAFGPTDAGRLLVIVFEARSRGLARVIKGWDMNGAERRYYQRHRR